MRITNLMMSNTMLGNINRNQRLANNLLQQISTQRRISFASENPLMAARHLRLTNTRSQIEQHQRNVDKATAWTEITEQSMRDLTRVTTDISELLTRIDAAESLADRQTISNEILGKLEEKTIILNRTFQGRYIFSGFRTDQPPFFLRDMDDLSFENLRTTFNRSNLETTFALDRSGNHAPPADARTIQIHRFTLPHNGNPGSVSLSLGQPPTNVTATTIPKLPNGEINYSVMSDNGIYHNPATGEIITLNINNFEFTNGNIIVMYNQTGFRVGDLNPIVYMSGALTTPLESHLSALNNLLSNRTSGQIQPGSNTAETWQNILNWNSRVLPNSWSQMDPSIVSVNSALNRSFSTVPIANDHASTTAGIMNWLNSVATTNPPWALNTTGVITGIGDKVENLFQYFSDNAITDPLQKQNHLNGLLDNLLGDPLNSDNTIGIFNRTASEASLISVLYPNNSSLPAWDANPSQTLANITDWLHANIPGNWHLNVDLASAIFNYAPENVAGLNNMLNSLLVPSNFVYVNSLSSNPSNDTEMNNLFNYVHTTSNFSFFMDFEMANQNMLFEFGVHSTMPINLLAKNVFTPQTFADIRGFANDILAKQQTSKQELVALFQGPPHNLSYDVASARANEILVRESALLETITNDRINNLIGRMDDHAQTISLQTTEIGTRMRRLALIEERLEDDSEVFEDLEGRNIGTNVIEATSRLLAAEVALTASMQVGMHNILRLTLLNFL